MGKEIKYLGEEALKSLAKHTIDSLNNKQDKLTGQKNQIIGFDEKGNAVVKDIEPYINEVIQAAIGNAMKADY